MGNDNAIERACVMHTWTAQANWDAPTIVGGKGAVFWDTDGKEYIDMSSMAECSNLGHQHPKVVRAIKKQAGKMCFVTSSWGSKPRAKLAEKLLEISGFEGGQVFFTTGGADANENAVKIARWKAGKRDGKIITRYRSYHGATHFAMELSGDDRGKEYPRNSGGVLRAPAPYCYRCPLGRVHSSCGISCADYVAGMIESEGPENIAAVLMEPNAGTNGIVAPPEYWPKIREICSRYGILLIADEVMSGFGRCGEWFAWQKYGSGKRPDIMTLAKGLTGAHVPLGAVVVSKEIAEYFEHRMLWTGLTYSGHPLACAAGVAAVNAYRDENLTYKSKALGREMHDVLRLFCVKHPSIGDVRGEGLFAIIELVKNRKTREPLSRWPEIAPALKQLATEGRKLGVSFAVRGNLIVLAPPLVITERQLVDALKVLDKLLEGCDAETT